MFFFNFTDDPIKLKLVFKEKGNVSLLDFSSLIYDLNLFYDAVVLANVDDYKEYNFTQYFWFRKGRAIRQEHQLYLARVRYESPLELVTILFAAAAAPAFLWALVQLFEKISNWDLNRQKLELEVSNLIQEDIANKLDNEKRRLEIAAMISHRRALQTIEQVAHRLNRYNITAIAADIFRGPEKKDTPENGG